MINGWWFHWNVHWKLHFTNQTIMEMIRLMIQHVRWSLEHLGWSIQSFSDNKLHIESICWVEQAQYLSALATGQKKHFKVGCGLVVRNPAENLIPGEGPNKHRLYAGQIRNFHSSFWCAKKWGYLWILGCASHLFLLADIQKNNDGTRGILMDIPQLNGGLPRRQPERPLPSLGGEVEPLDFGGGDHGWPKKTWESSTSKLANEGDEHGIV